MKINRRASLTFLPFMSLVAACSSATDDRTAASDDAIVDTGTPGYGPPSRADLTPLPVHGWFDQLDAHGAKIYEAQYSNGTDTKAPPTWYLDGDIPTAQTAWRTKLQGDAYESTVALGPDVDDSFVQMNADSDPSLLDGGGVAALFDLVSTLGGHASYTTKRRHFFGYEPLRARWRSRDWVNMSFRGIDLSRWTDRAPPPQLAEVRERGARLYCAARRARDISGAGVMTMGEQVGFRSSVLGHEIDFLVVEPTVVLGAAKATTQRPGRFSFPNDGAQSFEVPMRLGTIITPIRGIGLPGLPEIRYPVALTSADGEVGTSADFEPRGDGLYAPTKRYTTLAHGDAMATSSETISTDSGPPDKLPDAKITLFTTGLVTVDLHLRFDFDLGQPTPKDDRVLATAHVDSTFARTTRAGDLFWYGPRRYHDGAWDYKPACGTELHPCPPWDWQMLPTNPYFQTTSAAIGAMNTRALQDDDHVLQSRSALTLTGVIHGMVGVPRIGPFEVHADITGGIRGTVGQSHVIRDALYAEGGDGTAPMRAVTGVTVRPKTDASATLLDTSATMHLTIDLGWFGEVTWDTNLFTIPGVTLASYDSDKTNDWTESSTLRIGTGSNVGNPMKNPTVHTHVPGGDEQSSFGPGRDVDTCLAQPPDTRPEPPPCAAKPTVGAAPRANTCVYANVQAPNAACANIAATVAALGVSDGMAACWTQYLQLLCSPTSYENPAMVSHVLDDGTPQTLAANMTALGEVQNTCVHAAVPRTGDPVADKAAAKAFIDSFFHLAVCDGTGRPLSPGEILGPSSDTSTTPTPAGTCH